MKQFVDSFEKEWFGEDIKNIVDYSDLPELIPYDSEKDEGSNWLNEVD
jgi:hypothetical protein